MRPDGGEGGAHEGGCAPQRVMVQARGGAPGGTVV